MAVHLPRLSTDRLRYSSIAKAGGHPFALYAKIGNAFIITALDEAADKADLRPGLSLSDARALRPDLVTQAADDAADLALLDEIAAWCERFSPIVALDPPDGLFLDISGCAHLFGGEIEMLRALKHGLRKQSFNVRAAIAPNPGAAWACARFGQARIVTEDNLQNALAPLPLFALRLTDEAAALLKRLGLESIGQIMHAPRRPFTARAGQNAILRLDQALGRAPEALHARRPPPPVFALRRLAEPILTLDAITRVAHDLCDDLAAKLAQRGLGARLLQLSLFGVDAKARRLRLALGRAEQDAQTLARLFKDKLCHAPENLDAESGFEAMRLDALEIAPIIFHTTDLAPAAKRDLRAEARLMDAICARLGAGRAGHVTLRDVHAPERASYFAPFLAERTHSAMPAPTPPRDNVMRRPLFLLGKSQPIEVIASVPDGPPARFRWRRVLHRLVRAEGPERIAPHWLHAPSARARDYYRVEDQDGRRFWLYREGLYEAADLEAPPRWFIQGLFA